MKLIDLGITKDGTVDPLWKHLLISVGIGLVATVAVKVLAGVAPLLLIGGGIWHGYMSWKADKRINGGDASTD